MLTLTLGAATILAHVWEQDMGGEFPGTCEWSLKAGQLRIILARFPKMESDGGIAEGIGNAVEEISDEEIEGIETMDDAQDISFRDADTGIKLLRAMAEIGGTWDVTWNGEGRTWFFHDWDHAEHDCTMANGLPEITITDHGEERAQVNGARAALANRAPIYHVVESVVSILDEFETRFKYRPSLFGRIFDGFTIANA